jgi:hypothetical protein
MEGKKRHGGGFGVEGKRRHDDGFGVKGKRRHGGGSVSMSKRLKRWERRLKRHFVPPARVVEA